MFTLLLIKYTYIHTYIGLFNKRIIHYIEVKTVMSVIQASAELFILYNIPKLQIMRKYCLIYSSLVRFGVLLGKWLK